MLSPVKLFIVVIRLLCFLCPLQYEIAQSSKGNLPNPAEVRGIYVSEYRKRDLMAQKLFFELLIPSYSMIFEF